ncbi:hypothetical protein [Legionella jordanis]|uniref:Uncharacterized protein n=1 Tax=Legionella jordanis TaxID=456 RepID=A0A0W0VDL2_9GAMM|nr:hypothetical protein [Legionella jordanis]KTD18236.1 hypothetical protein Ljor_2542 [Legionella jordanis]RMX01193.1 hypothetical protein EAW55_11485 [Legionella jordanis]RMX21423.1 hypothetical protein EAS68_04450 [Legionella jordanis]VEH13671.1 Uncharacterised protein [Legionella jordanis]HAT8714618.1 hypothetical protein [Legionella jordanis]
MSILEKETEDSLIEPELDLSEDLKLSGTSNDFNQNQFQGGDMVDLLGDGVPGYETTGEDETDDDIALNVLNKKPTP